MFGTQSEQEERGRIAISERRASLLEKRMILKTQIAYDSGFRIFYDTSGGIIVSRAKGDDQF